MDFLHSQGRIAVYGVGAWESPFLTSSSDEMVGMPKLKKMPAIDLELDYDRLFKMSHNQEGSLAKLLEIPCLANASVFY